MSNVTLSSVETEALVGRIVRYMLFSSYEKPGVPVPRTKLSELVLSDNKNHKHSKHLLAKTLPEAQVIICVGGIEFWDLRVALRQVSSM